MIKKIVLVSPEPCYGGALAIFKLCRLLEDKNIDARIYLYDKFWSFRKNSPLKNVLIYVANILRNTAYNLKCQMLLLLEFLHLVSPSYKPIKCRFKRFPFFSKDTIVLYPDVIYGNPLRARKVVRWFLFHNRFQNDCDAFGKGDLFFCYRQIFNDYKWNPTCRILTICHFDSELYKRTNYGHRSGVCYIIRKGRNRVDLPKVYDGPVIDDLPEKEKVAVLNRCKYCFDYDTQTFYDSIACVCGCIPIVVMEPGKTKSDYVKGSDKDWGIAYGSTPEQIDYAAKTRQQRIDLLDFEGKNKKNVDSFIQEIQNYFE